MLSPERATPGRPHTQARDLEQSIAGNVAEILETLRWLTGATANSAIFEHVYESHPEREASIYARAV